MSLIIAANISTRQGNLRRAWLWYHVKPTMKVSRNATDMAKPIMNCLDSPLAAKNPHATMHNATKVPAARRNIITLLIVVFILDGASSNLGITTSAPPIHVPVINMAKMTREYCQLLKSPKS